MSLHTGRRRSWLEANLIVFAAYFVAAYIGDESGLILFGNLTLFWPPSGIALAGVLFLGYRVAPAVWLGSAAGNIVVFINPDAIPMSIAVNAGVGLGSALQAVVGGYLIRRACGDRDPLETVADVIKFIALAGLLSSLVSSTIAAPLLTVGGFSAWENFFSFAWTWWLGDATGILVITPLLLVWIQRPRPQLRSVTQALALLAALAAVGQIVFGIFGGPPHHYALAHMFLPLLVWATLGFGPHGAVTTIFLVYMMAMIATPLGRGPFALESQDLSVLLLQLFLGDLALTTLALSAMLTQRERADMKLRRAHDDLERMVVERTQELSEANAWLLQERNFSSAILDLAEALIVVLDRDGRIVRFNRACEKLTGANLPDVQGHRFGELFVVPEDAEAFEREFQQVLAGSPSATNEGAWLTHKGKRIIETTEALLPRSNGNAEFVIIAGLDVTERKEVEHARARLLEQERTARLEAERSVTLRDDFISIASHELKSPLTPLKIYIDLLKRHLLTADSKAFPKLSALVTSVANTDRQIDRLAALVDGLLDVSRITAGRLILKYEEFDLSSLVREVVERQRPEFVQANCEVEIRAEAAVTGFWDRTRIEQVATNLLTNAHKYGAGKPIEVEVSVVGGRARLSVRDHGIGIAKEDQEKIFGRFERVAPIKHYGGMGLGLFITREIVAAHDGTIWVESEPGEGSVFIVELPLELEARRGVPREHPVHSA